MHPDFTPEEPHRLYSLDEVLGPLSLGTPESETLFDRIGNYLRAGSTYGRQDKEVFPFTSQAVRSYLEVSMSLFYYEVGLHAGPASSVVDEFVASFNPMRTIIDHTLSGKVVDYLVFLPEFFAELHVSQSKSLSADGNYQTARYARDVATGFRSCAGEIRTLFNRSIPQNDPVACLHANISAFQAIKDCTSYVECIARELVSNFPVFAAEAVLPDTKDSIGSHLFRAVDFVKPVLEGLERVGDVYVTEYASRQSQFYADIERAAQQVSRVTGETPVQVVQTPDGRQAVLKTIFTREEAKDHLFFLEEYARDMSDALIHLFQLVGDVDKESVNRDSLWRSFSQKYADFAYQQLHMIYG